MSSAIISLVPPLYTRAAGTPFPVGFGVRVWGIHPDMSFGRNPHVAKAQAAELKARDARDAASHAHAWREAARQWERAAAREASDKLRREYTDKADAARANADVPVGTVEPDTLPRLDRARAKLLN